MMRVAPLVAGNESLQILLDVARGLSKREAQPVRDAENVRIDSERRLFEGDGHNDARRFSSDSREGFKLFAI